jgi:hypothetical protein
MAAFVSCLLAVVGDFEVGSSARARKLRILGCNAFASLPSGNLSLIWFLARDM